MPPKKKQRTQKQQQESHYEQLITNQEFDEQFRPKKFAKELKAPEAAPKVFDVLIKTKNEELKQKCFALLWYYSDEHDYTNGELFDLILMEQQLSMITALLLLKHKPITVPLKELVNKYAHSATSCTNMVQARYVVMRSAEMSYDTRALPTIQDFCDIIPVHPAVVEQLAQGIVERENLEEEPEAFDIVILWHPFMNNNVQIYYWLCLLSYIHHAFDSCMDENRSQSDEDEVVDEDAPMKTSEAKNKFGHPISTLFLDRLNKTIDLFCPLFKTQDVSIRSVLLNFIAYNQSVIHAVKSIVPVVEFLFSCYHDEAIRFSLKWKMPVSLDGISSEELPKGPYMRDVENLIKRHAQADESKKLLDELCIMSQETNALVLQMAKDAMSQLNDWKLFARGFTFLGGMNEEERNSYTEQAIKFYESFATPPEFFTHALFATLHAEPNLSYKLLHKAYDLLTCPYSYTATATVEALLNYVKNYALEYDITISIKRLELLRALAYELPKCKDIVHHIIAASAHNFAQPVILSIIQMYCSAITELSKLERTDESNKSMLQALEKCIAAYKSALPNLKNVISVLMCSFSSEPSMVASRCLQAAARNPYNWMDEDIWFSVLDKLLDEAVNNSRDDYTDIYYYLAAPFAEIANRAAGIDYDAFLSVFKPASNTKIGATLMCLISAHYDSKSGGYPLSQAELDQTISKLQDAGYGTLNPYFNDVNNISVTVSRYYSWLILLIDHPHVITDKPAIVKNSLQSLAHSEACPYPVLIAVCKCSYYCVDVCKSHLEFMLLCASNNFLDNAVKYHFATAFLIIRKSCSSIAWLQLVQELPNPKQVKMLHTLLYSCSPFIEVTSAFTDTRVLFK